MVFELFGTKFDQVEYLGNFVEEQHLLEALDEYAGMGYEKLKYCKVCY